MRRVFVVLSALAVLVPLFAMSGTVFAVSRSTSMAASHSTSAVNFDVPFTAPVDFGAVQKICPHVSIHLKGVQHTLICNKAQGVPPNLYRSPCTSFENIFISNYNGNGVLCFSGSGYLGVTIYQVNEVYNIVGQGVALTMWMRYYHPSGVTCTILAYNDKYFGSGNTNVTVTQLDWGGHNGPNC